MELANFANLLVSTQKPMRRQFAWALCCSCCENWMLCSDIGFITPSDTSNHNDKDHISALPDDVLHTIVNLLSMRDAIRTSKLSRRWKNIYAHKSRLEFDWPNIISNYANTYTHGMVSIRNVRYFQRSIEAVLASHSGTKIESFKVQCCIGNEHPRYFKGWINFSVTLELAFSCDELSERTDWTTIDCYNFPTHLLLISGEGSKLRHLSLRTCKLRADNIFLLIDLAHSRTLFCVMLSLLEK
ncbi:unnamed protein product [Prunus armeniaca]